MNKNRALGKGLSSLLPRSQAATAAAAAAPVANPGPPAAAPVTELPIDAIQTNPNQPRKEFRQAQLLELAVSITRDGVIQPLVVRQIGKIYELVAGERRLRASKLAGLEKVPVVVQEISDERLLEIALVENIQREDLNPIELAIAFGRMASELNLNHEEIGARTGKDRATITNSIRLLQLPAAIQEMVSKRELSPGHARAILKIQDEASQQELAKKIIAEGWTVRKAENYTPPTAETKASKAAFSPEISDPNVRAAVQEMERALGTRVRIHEKSPGKGKIEIEYYSTDDLDRIYNLISTQS
jgi:ParB family chromosome partitioning protein